MTLTRRVEARRIVYCKNLTDQKSKWNSVHCFGNRSKISPVNMALGTSSSARGSRHSCSKLPAAQRQFLVLVRFRSRTNKKMQCIVAATQLHRGSNKSGNFTAREMSRATLPQIKLTRGVVAQRQHIVSFCMCVTES